MNQEQVKIEGALEKELNKTIKELACKPSLETTLLEKQLLQVAFEDFIELSCLISQKANGRDLDHYGDTVKLTGLALKYLLKQEIPLSDIANVFTFWSHRKILAITDWNSEDLVGVDDFESNEDELDQLLCNLDPTQLMTFFGLHHAYHFFAEMIAGELYSLSEIKDDWLKLINTVQADVVRFSKAE